MDIVTFVLGSLSAIVVILVAAVVILLLRTKNIKHVEEEVYRAFESNHNELERNLTEKIDAFQRSVSSDHEEIYRQIENTLKDSKSYTDGRVDKVLEKVK